MAPQIILLLLLPKEELQYWVKGRLWNLSVINSPISLIATTMLRREEDKKCHQLIINNNICSKSKIMRGLQATQLLAMTNTTKLQATPITKTNALKNFHLKVKISTKWVPVIKMKSVSNGTNN